MRIKPKFSCLLLLCFCLSTLQAVSWAQGVVTLPQTGQAKCYNASPGVEVACAGTEQDGEYQMGADWPDPRFTPSGDCMTDHLTGLMWSKNANLPDGTMSWQEALDYVASLNSGAGLCGYHDWRLPNINELESLVNAGVVHLHTWLISQGFSNVQLTEYWSSTTSAVPTDDAWFSYMVVCYTGHASKDFSAYYVWPVRSGQLDNADPLYPANIWKTGQTTSYASMDDGDLKRGVSWPAPRFDDPGDGTITDNLTGLMWSKNGDLPNGTTDWQGALDYVKALNTGAGLSGYHDWRLPNRKELFSLTDFSRYYPALPDGHPFENVQSNKYWSSTASSNNRLVAWSVVIWDGTVSHNYKSDTYFVWPVRSDYPDISVTPDPVLFGNVNVGSTSDQNITVGNGGTANLVISTIINPGAPFSKQTDSCSGQSISPGGTCMVTYRFAPTSVSAFSTNSDIPSNDPDQPNVVVSLTGNGVVPQIILSSGSLNFGNVLMNGSSGQTITVQNGGVGILSIGNITSPLSPFTKSTDDCSNQNLASGATCTIGISFSPVSSDEFASSFSLPSNDPDGSKTVPLVGRGVQFLVNPQQGTLGTLITVEGTGFGVSKGKILMGSIALKVSSWGSTEINASLSKATTPGSYDVTVQPKTKGSNPIFEGDFFTVKAPEIDSIERREGSAYDQVTVKGKFFGTKKGKVFLEYEEGGQPVSKSCKVTKWWMDPVTNKSEIFFIVPKMLPEVYNVVVDPASPLPDAEEEDGFTVKLPEIVSVGPGSGSVGTQITISGNFFGSKKPKVYLGYLSKGKPTKKSCPIFSSGDDEIVFTVPNLPVGSYDVMVTNSVGSIQYGQKFYIIE